MARPNVLTAHQEAEAVRLWKEGTPIKDIANHFGCSPSPVSGALSKAGIKRRRPVRKLDDPILQAEIVSAYLADEAVTSNVLARRHRTHVNEIRRVLHMHDVPLRDGRTRRGTQNPIFRTGRWIDAEGYVRVYVADDDPMVAVRSDRRYAMEHRLVMSHHLGRPLGSHERVHHKNGIKDDNRIENLELWSYSHPPGQRVNDKPPHCPTCTC